VRHQVTARCLSSGPLEKVVSRRLQILQSFVNVIFDFPIIQFSEKIPHMLADDFFRVVAEPFFMPFIDEAETLISINIRNICRYAIEDKAVSFSDFTQLLLEKLIFGFVD
jgi:hypothetical protein